MLSKIDPWHLWLINLTKFPDPVKIDPWHAWLINPITNLLILLKSTRGTRGYLTRSQNLLIKSKINLWHGWLINLVTNLLMLLKLTRGTGG
jgi:hypothetical protein